MFLEFHVANLPPEISLEQIHEFFSQYGKISNLRFLVRKDGTSFGSAHLKIDLGFERDSEEYHKFLEETNKIMVNDQQLYVTPSKPGKITPITASMTQHIGKVIKELDETDTVPRYQIQRFFQFCHPDIVYRILQETLQIEAEGGLLTQDRSRRRTLGGVFFHLVRLRISGHFQRVILITPEELRKRREAANAKQEQREKERLTAAPLPAPKAAKAPKAPKGKEAAKKPAKPPIPPKSVPIVPASDPEALKQAQEEFLVLRHAYQRAQEQLDALKTLPAAERKSGLFSATREVVNIQKQMTALIKQYPELNNF